MKIKNATKQGYLEAKIGDGIDISSRMKSHRGTVQKGISQTLTCQGGNNVGVIVDSMDSIKIRMLTPKECIKLMGFERKDYQAMVDAGLSDSAIYHCAGDSIVVSVLIGIFGQMFDLNVKEKLESYNEKVVKGN